MAVLKGGFQRRMGILSHAKRTINRALLKVGHRIDLTQSFRRLSIWLSTSKRAGLHLPPSSTSAWPTAPNGSTTPGPKRATSVRSDAPIAASYGSVGQSLKATVVNKALGEMNETVMLHVRPDHSGSLSTMKWGASLSPKAGSLKWSASMELFRQIFSGRPWRRSTCREPKCAC